MDLQKEVKKVASDLDLSQIFGLLREAIDASLGSDDKSNQNGLLLKLAGAEKLKEQASNLVEFLTTIPRNYYVFISLPHFVDTPFSFTKISENIDLVRIHGAPLVGIPVTKRSKALSSLSQSECPLPKPGHYLRIRVKGYCDGSTTNCIEAGLSSFKQYILMGILTGKFDFSYSSSFWPSQIDPMVFYFDVEDPSRTGRLKISESLSSLIKNIRLHEAPLKDALKQKEESAPRTILGFSGPQNPYPLGTKGTAILNSAETNENTASIKNALEWGFDSLASQADQTLSFMQLCISLEAILGIDSPKTGVTERLGDRCAYLLGRNVTERKKIRDEFKDFYKVRSHLIHGRSKKLSRKDSDWLYWGRDILFRVLNREIHWARELENS